MFSCLGSWFVFRSPESTTIERFYRSPRTPHERESRRARLALRTSELYKLWPCLLLSCASDAAVRPQFWRLEVRHRGRRLSAEQLAFHVRAVIEDGQKEPGVQLGLLTTANRRLWAQWRHQLLQGAKSIRRPLFPSRSILRRTGDH